MNEQFNFSRMLELLKEGKPLCREGWNGKGMYIYYVPAARYKAMTDVAKRDFGEDAMIQYEAYIAMKNAQGTVSIWNPSQVDLFAEDWMIANYWAETNK